MQIETDKNYIIQIGKLAKQTFYGNYTLNDSLIIF
jgi:hypothetical protein